MRGHIQISTLIRIMEKIHLTFKHNVNVHARRGLNVHALFFECRYYEQFEGSSHKIYTCISREAKLISLHY